MCSRWNVVVVENVLACSEDAHCQKTLTRFHRFAFLRFPLTLPCEVALSVVHSKLIQLLENVIDRLLMESINGLFLAPHLYRA